MAINRAQELRLEVCAAGRVIRAKFGLEKALWYMVGEKVLLFMSQAQDYPAWAAELPPLVAEIRQIFSEQEIKQQLKELQRKRIITKNPRPNEFGRRPFARAELESLLGGVCTNSAGRCSSMAKSPPTCRWQKLPRSWKSR
jgi:hypothetical protein